MAAAGAPDGMEEPGMDTEAETVATEGPARPLNCLEAEAAAGAAAEDSCAARGSLQPAPAQPPGDLAAQASVSNGEDAGGGAGRELVDLKIIWNKTKHDVKFPLDSTGSELKQKIHSITGLPPAMQKVMYKGLVPEDKTLREIKVTSGAKIMVVGSTINDVLAVNTPKDAAQQDAKAEENKKEPLCRQKQHRKVLDKGKPEDVMPSVKGAQERLPSVPLSGMYNKSGGKVRLTFKLEQDQLWIGTKEAKDLAILDLHFHMATISRSRAVVSDSWREPNMPNSPVSGQHCRYSVFEVNGKEKYRGSHRLRLLGFRDRPFSMILLKTGPKFFGK
ncbi:ubiquitin domain-containing protein UBFD1 isoform X1 [Physeter macrocephalus]|uniref:Ubiquitin domain-containing protein UBFD1 n=1 Tax=Physeter macrocephalus TaxID=9755 RepID=A0A455BZQ6_PHYMC|nr:ubiquitin domain-containing protein UBFD1 isoform X1 [Physeter catodon]|eukprot:XP_028354182.1 ubiquitin domain-containing protein UBFD1 isoform X3 [Physeter catodon]